MDPRRTERAADSAGRDQASENETRRLLRDLVRRAVPPVPRKLNRVGELYGLYLDVARENDWSLPERAQRLTLLRLVILQLFAPDLYRFGRLNKVFLAKMEAWKREAPGGEGLDLNRLEDELKSKAAEQEKKLKDNPQDTTAAADLYSLKRIDLRLLAQIRSGQQQRSRFDPLRLVDPGQPSSEPLAPFFNLEVGKTLLDVQSARHVQATARADLSRTSTGAAGFEATKLEETLPATEGLDDLEGFLRQLLSTDALSWRNALEQEAENLAGRVLDKESFDALLERVRSVPNFVGMDWLELIAPHLTAEQLFALFQESRLLSKLVKEI